MEMQTTSSSPPSDTNNPLPATPSVEALLLQCRALLAELAQFQAFLVAHKQDHAVELRHFHNSVQSELKSLERLSTADPTAPQTVHTVRSSNLPFYQSVWAAAKASKALVTFSKRFYWEMPPRLRGEDGKKLPRPCKKRCALVDIVAHGGAEWIKVSTITESRLLFEKAKAGWEAAEWADDADESDEGRDGGKVLAEGAEALTLQDRGGGEAGDSSDDEFDGRVELLKIAQDLRKASRAVRVHYKHPRIRFILPKIEENHDAVIDTILDEIRATGATVQCGAIMTPQTTQPSRTNGTSTDHPVPLNANESHMDSVFAPLLLPSHPPLTPTLNLDCTILLALISDLSHLSPDTLSLPATTSHPSLVRQLALETSSPLLPTILYPGLAGRPLLTSGPSAGRMREIVDQIGTPSERHRADLLLGEGTAATSSADELVSRFAASSTHAAPALRLPVRVVHEAIDVVASLPPVARTVEGKLSAINHSVFLLGWARRLATVTSNRAIARVVEGCVLDALDEMDGEGEEGEGPVVWVVAVARSLVGRERRGAGKAGGGDGAGRGRELRVSHDGGCWVDQ